MGREEERKGGEGRRKRIIKGGGRRDKERTNQYSVEDGFLPYAASLCWRPYLVNDLLVHGILGGGVCSSLTI